jgi:hypothetical protein
MPLLNPSYVAGENITPARFLTRDTTEGNAVLMADDGTAAIVGVSMNGTRQAPIPSVSESLAAEDGETFRVHGLGDTCEVLSGEALDDGAEVTAGANGVAVAATGGDYVGGVVQRGVASGSKAWIQVVNYQKNA